jgi:hypothetical protein
MKEFTLTFVLDDWQIGERTVRAKTPKEARDKVRAWVKRRGKFKSATYFTTRSVVDVPRKKSA